MTPFRLAALVLAIGLTSSSVYAQDMERARAIFEEGLEHSQGEHWVPALEAFRRSLEIAEMPVTLYNIASVLIRLGRMQEAIATLERYKEVAEPSARSEADPLLAQARAAVRRVRATIEPAHATLSIDGNDVPGEGRERMLQVDPGSHVVRGRARGYEPREITLGADALVLSMTLAAQLAVVMVRASETEARILVDGAHRGVGEARLELEAGDYELRVEADGAQPFTRRLSLDPGEQLDVEAALSRDLPLWKRGWFWGVVSGAALAIALGVILAVVLPLPAENPNSGTLDWLVRP